MSLKHSFLEGYKITYHVLTGSTKKSRCVIPGLISGSALVTHVSTELPGLSAPTVQAEPATARAALWMGKWLRAAPVMSAAQTQQPAWRPTDKQTERLPPSNPSATSVLGEKSQSDSGLEPGGTARPPLQHPRLHVPQWSQPDSQLLKTPLKDRII